MDATRLYRLELEPPKCNVFVTQLNEREDDDVTVFPVINIGADKLLQSSGKTLQKTLLLQQEVESEHVENDRKAKVEEFRWRMDVCAQRRLDIELKQQQMKNRVNKFDKFIKDNEMKRRRAIEKYQQEVTQRLHKNKEFEIACHHLDELMKIHEYLRKRLAMYRKFETYLLKVIEILPPHYLQISDSMINSLMMRHKTLSNTNDMLVENLQNMSDQIEELRGELDGMVVEHDKMKLSINSLLSQQQKNQDTQMDRNNKMELRQSMHLIQFRSQVVEYGQIMSTLDNMVEKCRSRESAAKDLSTSDKLKMIKNYMTYLNDVARTVGAEIKLQSSDSKLKTVPKEVGFVVHAGSVD